MDTEKAKGDLGALYLLRENLERNKLQVEAQIEEIERRILLTRGFLQALEGLEPAGEARVSEGIKKGNGGTDSAGRTP